MIVELSQDDWRKVCDWLMVAATQRPSSLHNLSRADLARIYMEIALQTEFEAQGPLSQEEE